MQRIHAPFDEPTLAQIDLEVQKKGISRAQWLCAAASAYLRLGELSNGANPEDLILEMAQMRRTNGKPLEELEKMRTELESIRSNMSPLERDIAHYKETLSLKDHQISFLEAHVSQLTQSIQLALPQMKEEELQKKKRHWYWPFGGGSSTTTQ